MGKPTKRESPRDDTASTSSAVLLDNIDYYDEEDEEIDEDLPAYDDIPQVIKPTPSVSRTNYLVRPKVPESVVSKDKKTISTLSPHYTLYTDALQELVTVQAKYPPAFTVNVQGSHTEKTKRNNKTEQNTITDFDFNLDLTHLLISPQTGRPAGEMEMVPEGQKAYRGTRRPRETKIVDIEAGNDLAAWCARYCADPSNVKSFTLKRKVEGLDEALMRGFIESIIRSTNYLGHIYVSFPVTAKNVVVYSPGKINRLRTIWYVRWLFYLTFLWIFAWPYLFFVTKRYEVVNARFYFARREPCPTDESLFVKTYTSMAEETFINKWRIAIKRAALGGLKGCVNEDYLLESLRVENGGVQRTPSTGNAIADGALGFLQQALVVGRDINNIRGWGGDQ